MNKSPRKQTDSRPPDLTREERAFWEYKRRFLMNRLRFSEQEASEGATNAVLAFREANVAA